MRIAVLVSGSGSNLQALIDAQARGELGRAQIVHVLSNRSQVLALARAARAGIAHHTLTFASLGLQPSQQADRQHYDAAVAAHLQSLQLDMVVLAGWMYIFGAEFLAQIGIPLINLHPALPGQFPGAQAMEDAFAAFQAGQVQGSGCMVHRVITEVDAGEVLDVEHVPILASDDLDTFEARMHAAEHRLMVRCVRVLSLRT